MAEAGGASTERTAIAAAESENKEGAERNEGRELVDYREAASQRDWWKKRVRIKLHKNPKLREGEAKSDIRKASSRTAGEEKAHG
jgi:hypothetical protein